MNNYFEDKETKYEHRKKMLLYILIILVISYTAYLVFQTIPSEIFDPCNDPTTICIKIPEVWNERIR